MRRKCLLLTLVCAFLLSSCQHKELCFDHSHMVGLEVRFDWSDAPDAAPKTMVLQVFRKDGSFYDRCEFSSKYGGKYNIEAGEYLFLFHNGEMSSVVEEGESYGDYGLTTKTQSLLAPMGKSGMSAPPRPEEAENEPVLEVPEDIWGGCSGPVVIPREEQGLSLVLKPARATARYTVELRDVRNLSESVEISAALTGMARSWRISDNTLSEQTATISFGMARKDGNSLTSGFALFGDSPGHTGRHFLSVYSSNKRYKDFDVTDQIHQAKDPKNVTIVVSGMELPEEGEGMSPSVSGWEEEEVSVNMN